MRILVVEDERKVARFIERGLKEERFSFTMLACSPMSLQTF
jgi:DNA-binding response OmpR family regulator